MPDRVVMITGASSGIGLATARRLARDGACLALAARREGRLREIAAEVQALGGNPLVIPTDVRDRAAIHAMVQATLDQWGRIDALVNNAGLAHGAHVVDLDPDNVREQVDVNLVALMECAQAVLPSMIARRAGQIINVASIAGLVAVPGSAVYSATKFGVVGFSDALRREVRSYGVRVTTFCPGFVATPFSADLQRIAEGDRKASWLPGVMRVEYVADQIARLIRHPRRQLIIPPGWGLPVAFARAYPWLVDIVLSWVDRHGLARR